MPPRQGKRCRTRHWVGVVTLVLASGHEETSLYFRAVLRPVVTYV
jgi:hypothetical protein